MKRFQELLRAHKGRLGITQAELGKILGVSKRSVEFWLSGQRRPKGITAEGAISRLQKIRKYEVREKLGQ